VQRQNQNRTQTHMVKLLSAALAAVVCFTPVAYASTLDDQISQLSTSIQNQQNQAAQLHSQANTIQNQVAILDSQISQVRSEIQLNKAKAQRLDAQIADAQQQLTTKKEILDEEVRAIYQNSQVTPLEMLASSKNFSDYVDKQQYSDQIKDHVQDELKQVNQLKAQLEQQQTELNAALASQTAQQNSLLSLENQQAILLNQTQSQASNADQAATNGKTQLQGLYAQRAALDAKNGVTIATDGSNGGYPWANNDPNGVDPYGYYYRQCVSFAAWHRYYYHDGIFMPDHWGNAGEWVNHAPHNGTPSVGAIAVLPPNGSSGAGGVGHVAIVIGVHGGTIDVAEYNWLPLQYDTRYNVPIADMSFIH